MKKPRKPLTVYQLRRNLIVFGSLQGLLSFGCLGMSMRHSLWYLIPMLMMFVSCLLTFSCVEDDVRFQ